MLSAQLVKLELDALVMERVFVVSLAFLEMCSLYLYGLFLERAHGTNQKRCEEVE